MGIHGALLASVLPGSPVSGRECAWMGYTPSANDTDVLVLECLKADTQKLLDAHEIRGTVQARVKSAASLLAKMRRKGLEANRVFDRLALRVIVEDVSTAYKVRDLLERRHRVIEGRRKDYISNPKPNGYQSLHSSVQTLLGPVAEFQVRTHQMHFEAEHGDAAH